MSDSRGAQPVRERTKPELCHGPESGLQNRPPVTVSPPAMNEDLPQNESLDQLENWLPATFAEGGEEEGAEGLQKPGHPCQEGVEIFCSRSTESSSSGNEFNGLRSSGTSAHNLELNGGSDQNPGGQGRSSSSSSSSSEPLSWHQSHKKLMSVIREMKRFLPAEKFENCGKTSTLSTLNYALKCVRQIQDSNAFRVFDEHGASRASAGVYSIEELAAVTSEHTPKNTDTFVAVFSLLSGQMMHVSEQAASILNCKKKTLDSSRFAELLAPQDVGVFYTYINQSHLPLWNMEAQKASLYKYAQVKSFFCRIRGGQDQEKRYFPFRITPYLVNICTSDNSELETCCLALAEKIHSGYEAPRIPLDKRIFTTTHSPGCVFLEIDDRAVPLLGYLPQDLTGTSILMHLHPEDRPLMVAVHRKVLKFAGQPPFEHSPIRFCTQNGDYVILDTSWSSFMNPWSRKVVFIVGRHKVRTSPLNEDVFAARSREISRMDTEIRALQGQIYKLLLQPVHSNGSSGYGSLISNGSHEHYISVASSSDSNGNCVEEMQKEPMTLQQVFVDVNRLKNVGQQLYIESHSKHPSGKGRALRAELQGDKKDAASSLTRVMRTGSAGDLLPASCSDLRSTHHILSYQQINCMDSIIRYLESCSVPALKRKCESSTNAASSSSSSSDDDKQGQLSRNAVQTLEDASGLSSITSQPPVVSKPEEAIMSQAPATVVGPPMTDLALRAKALSVVSVTSQCSYSSTIVHVPHPESEVTAIEEAPLQSEPLELPPASAPSVAPEEIRLVGLTKEVLSAHTQKEEQNYVDRFRHKILLSPYSSYLQQGATGSKQTPSQGRGDFPSKESTSVSCKRNSKQGKWKRQKALESSESNSPLKDGSSEQRTAAEQSSWVPGEGPCPGPSTVAFPLQPYSVPGFPLAPLGGDLALPSVAAAPVLPSCLPYCIQPTPAFPAPCGSSFTAVWLHTFPVCPLPPQPLFPAQHPCSASYPCTTMPPGPPSTMPSPTAPDPVEAASLPSTPLSAEDEHQEASGGQPPLFSNSRSSSPLQLNLLQEELPKLPHPPSDAQAEMSTEIKCEEEGKEDGDSHDGHSVSSELLDMLLLEDTQSGTGSAESGSRSAESGSSASGSNSSRSHGTSGCATGSGNSSKYFASNDSSEVSKRGEMKPKERGPGAACQPARLPWRAASCLPEPILMTYQVPKRIEEAVLKEDLEKLTAMENRQPWFTEGQKDELAEVHPWIRTGTIPQEINTQGCITCDSRNASREAALPEDGGIPEEDREDLLPSLAPA